MGGEGREKEVPLSISYSFSFSLALVLFCFSLQSFPPPNKWDNKTSKQADCTAQSRLWWAPTGAEEGARGREADGT